MSGTLAASATASNPVPPGYGVAPFELLNRQQAQGSNPLDMANQFATLQGKFQQNQLFQQTWAANRKAGEIMASSPTLDDAWQKIMADPSISPYAQEMMGKVNQVKQVMLQNQGLVAQQNQSALAAAMRGTAAAINSPDKFDQLLATQLAALPPELQKTAGPAILSYRAAMQSDDPATFRKNVASGMIGSNMSPASVAALFPSRPFVNLGGVTAQPVVPALEGPATMQGGAVFPNSLPPQVVIATQPSGAVQPYAVGGAPGALGGAPAGQGTGALGQSTAPAGGATAGVPSGGAVPLVPGSGQTTTERASLEATATSSAQRFTALENAIPEMRNQAYKLNNLITTLHNFMPGGLASVRTNVGQFAQAMKNMGIPISDGDIQAIANGSMSDSQFFDTQIKPFALSLMKSDIAGSGQWRLPEITSALDRISINNDPKVIMAALEQVEHGIRQDYDTGMMYNEFRRAVRNKDPSVKGMDVTDFPAWQAKQYDQGRQLPTSIGGMPTGSIQTGGGTNVGWAGGATGGGNQAPTLRWNPQTKTLERIGAPAGGQ